MSGKWRAAPGLVQKGDYVRRKGQVAQVVALFSDVEGGLVLDRQIDGFRCWNVKDVRRVETINPTPQRHTEGARQEGNDDGN